MYEGRNVVWLTIGGKTKTKTENLEDPTYAIFLKSRRSKDIKYRILSSHLVYQTRPGQTRPDQTRPNRTGPDQTRLGQTREDFNLADLIQQLVLLLHFCRVAKSNGNMSCVSRNIE